jgi:hypothetical protein
MSIVLIVASHASISVPLVLVLPQLTVRAFELTSQHVNTQEHAERHTQRPPCERGQSCASNQVAFKWSIIQLTFVGIDVCRRGRTGKKHRRGKEREGGGKTKKDSRTGHTEDTGTYWRLDEE